MSVAKIESEKIDAAKRTRTVRHFCKKPLWECSRTLIRVAQGLMPADLVIRDCKLVDVCTHEILEHTDIAIAEGRIAYVGINPHTAEHCIGPNTQVINAEGAYVAPGFLDGHMHIESSMVTPAEYARVAVPHGTTGVYYDPHEAGNVVGLEGIKEFAQSTESVPLKFMLTMPSCIPAVDGFEDTGAQIGPDDIAEAMTWPQTVGLGEMMNYPGLLACKDKVLDELAETLSTDKVATGHFPPYETDRQLNAYIASGTSSCHETSRPEDALAKARLGMYTMLRQGSAWHNLHDLAPVAASKGDQRFFQLVTDDCHISTLLKHGHLDYLLSLAVAEGIDATTAIQMVTINTATCFHMQDEIGSVTPGKCADLVFLENLEDFHVTRTIIDGDVVAKNGKALFEPEPFEWPEWMTSTMHVGEKIDATTFAIPARDAAGRSLAGKTSRAEVRAIRLEGGDTIAYEEHVEVTVKDGCFQADPVHDVLKAFVFERHHTTGTHAEGFVRGLGIHGALAQTVAHDAHNLLVVGDNDEDMAIAANALIKCGGGQVAVVDGEVKALLKLPLCGLMSLDAAEDVAKQVDELSNAWRAMNCNMPSPFMTLGLFSLACIPQLRLTNRGYVDCNTYTFVPLAVH